jgi:hypothetical protein
MARIDNWHGLSSAISHQVTTLQADHGTVNLPPHADIASADLAKNGYDLVITAADGSKIVVQNYFMAEPQPAIASAHGTLSADMVNAFVHHAGPMQMAGLATANDETPVGHVKEVTGHATIIHRDGTHEDITIGAAIHEGDVVETQGKGAVNIVFVDQSTFAVSENAKLAIDKYVFDPHSDAGDSHFSMLRGLFVYASGLIGREDPDDVKIETPVGSIGIRGTVIAGNASTGEITVVEGAIVLHSLNGDEMTLSNQYETARLSATSISKAETLTASDISAKFSSIGSVAPSFYSGLGDNADQSDHGLKPASEGTTGLHSDATPPAPVDHALSGISIDPSAPAFSQTNSFLSASALTTSSGADSTAPTAPASPIAAAAAAHPAAAAILSAAIATADGSINGALNLNNSALTILVSDVAPALRAASAVTISEAAANGTAVETITVANLHTPDPLTYSIAGGNTGNVFSIDSATGALSISNNSSLSHAATPSYTLTIDVSNGLHTASGTYTIDVSAVSPGNSLNNFSSTQGFFIADTADHGFGGSIAAVGDVYGNGYDNLVIGSTSGVYIYGGHSADGSDAAASGFFVSNTPITGAILAGAGTFEQSGTQDILFGSSSSGSGGAAVITDTAGTVITQLTGMITGDLTGQSVAGIGDITHDGYDDVLVGAPGAGSNAGKAYVIFGGDSETLSASLNVTQLGDSHVVGTDSASSPQAFALSGNYSYVVSATGELDVYDVSDPTLPTQVASLTDVGIATQLGPINALSGASHIVVENGYAYITASTSGDLTVIDVSNPSLPAWVTSLQQSALQNADGLIADGNLLLAVSSTNNTFSVIDTTTPSAPILLTTYSNNALEGATGVAVSADGSTAYVTSSTNHSVAIIDLANPNNVSLVNSITLPGLPSPGIIDVHGTTMYVVDATQGEIFSYDISSPTSPTLLSTFSNTSLVGATSLAISGDTMYVTDGGTSSLTEYNIHEPSSISEISTFSNSNALGGAVDVAVDANGLVHVIGATSGTYSIIDATPDGFAITGLGTGSAAGTIVSAAGDFNGDGYSDFAIASPGTSGTGRVDVAFGASDLSSITLGTGTFAITNIAESADKTIPVMYAGDLNGDGTSDLLIEAKGADNGNGMAYVVYGSASHEAGQTLDVTALSSANGFTINPGSELLVGAGAVGDFNGDGHDDIVVALKTAGSHTVDLYVLYGDTAATNSGTVTLSDLNNSTYADHMTYTIPSSVTAPDNFQLVIGAAGDLNGDGYADFSVGLPGTDGTSGNDQDGSTAIVYGTDTGIGNVVTDNTSGDASAVIGTVAASANDQSLVGSANADILNDSNLTGISLSGGAGNDTLQIHNLNFTHIDGGSGIDTLQLLNTGSIDFSALGSEKIEHVEAIDMGSTGQSLTLTMDNIFGMLNTSDNGTLTITSSGSASNTLIINNQTAGSAPSGASAQQIGAMIGASQVTTQGTGATAVYDFHIGNETLALNKTMVDSNHVHIA